MELQPYLFFYGRCEEAVEFYRKALGAEQIQLIRFKDAPERAPEGMLPPNYDDKIMHGEFRVGPTTVLVSDGGEAPKPYSGFSLALMVTSEAEADRAFDALKEGGEVRMPLAKTFWSPRFGMVTDRFGIGWMISTRAE